MMLQALLLVGDVVEAENEREKTRCDTVNDLRILYTFLRRIYETNGIAHSALQCVLCASGCCCCFSVV